MFHKDSAYRLRDSDFLYKHIGILCIVVTAKNSTRDLIAVRFVPYYAWPIGMAVVVYTTTRSYTKRMQELCVGCGFTTKVSAGVSRSTWKDNIVATVTYAALL